MEEKKELLDQDERVVEIELERLRGFVNHPFKVRADSQMIELQESIKKYGILNPLIVRPRQDGTYEIISGHRRKFAAEKIGYRKVPVIIRVLKDDEAVVSMVDSNLQREMISPSEKAFAYKMKYEAIKRKAGRRKCGQVDHNLGKKSIELIGEECGDSPKQVQRYIKITELIPEMLEKVDDGSMGFTPAVQLSFLKKKEQKEMLDAMEFAQCTPSLSQALRIKKLSADGKLTVRDMEDILSEIIFGDNVYANPGVSEEYERYAVPGEYLTDQQFSNMHREAEKYLGYPYVWGGSSPGTSFDCSGFVSYVINNCGNGWNYGRLTANGWKNATARVAASDVKPGDLVFFQGTYNTAGASHVGIVVDPVNKIMIHCGNPIQYASYDTPYWRAHAYCYGRIQ